MKYQLSRVDRLHGSEHEQPRWRIQHGGLRICQKRGPEEQVRIPQRIQMVGGRAVSGYLLTGASPLPLCGCLESPCPNGRCSRYLGQVCGDAYFT